MADTPSYDMASSPDEILSFTRFDTNTTTGAIAKIIERVNVTQSTVSYIDADTGGAYVVVGTVADRPLRVMISAETVASTDLDDAGGGVGISRPALANHGEVHVYDAAGSVYTLSGTAPAGAAATGATTGTRVNPGTTFELESADEMDAFLFNNLSTVAATAGAGLYIEYFNFGDSWSGITD